MEQQWSKDMRFFLTALLILSLAACESGPSTSDDGRPSESQSTDQQEESSESSSDESASSSTADDEPESTCFDTCMENNQMRSVPIEQIEDDCHEQCQQDGAPDDSAQ